MYTYVCYKDVYQFQCKNTSLCSITEQDDHITDVDLYGDLEVDINQQLSYNEVNIAMPILKGNYGLWQTSPVWGTNMKAFVCQILSFF